ncbi:MAG: alpha/beta hydrolase [Rhizobiaceae bacterium]|nr:alpha/beta hydrolase [Rhizobiaceae bacterium]
MKFVAILLILLVAGLSISTWLIVRDIEREFPPIGDFKTINGVKMHYVEAGIEKDTSKPAIVFIHGASGNLRDQMPVYKPRLERDFRLVFLDRPGHGYSDPFDGSNDPKRQADSISKLLTELEIEKAIIVGHSFGGVVTGAFGVLHAEKTAGLVFLAPVSHPWGTGVDWHYDLGNTPILGWLFSRLLLPSVGSYVYPKAIQNVFRPNPMPADYRETSGTRLSLRPSNFHENAKDVARVENHVSAFHERYQEIKAQTVIFHGDQDDIVSLEIHSINGLSKDIEDAKLIILEDVGHKPDYIAADQIEAEIRRIAELSK